MTVHGNFTFYGVGLLATAIREISGLAVQMANWMILLALPLLAFCLTACSTVNTPGAKRPVTLSLSVVASPSLNPDCRGRPSPVLVRLYELKSGTTFAKLDYLSLEGHDKTSLGQDLLASEELVIRPGQTTKLERRLNADTGAFGVFVGYRELGKANWRAIHALPAPQETTWYRSLLGAREVSLRIALGAEAVTVTTSD
jgi:type VI secretion system protein VasD